jgi:hypothetical protein
MKLNIDLGQKPESLPTLSKPSLENYPEVTFRTDEDIELPKTGRLVIDFEKTHGSVNEHKGRKTEYSCTICVKKLVSVNRKESDEDEVEAPVGKSSARETENSLDSIAKSQGY